MSVDKFGRYSESGSRSGSYGKRGGLPLTSDGDYDISNKRLKFVNDPKDDSDAINLKTLKSETSSSLKLLNNVYDANEHRIANLAKPVDKHDSVNKEYLMWHINQTLKYNAFSDNKLFDGKGLRIANIADPVDDKDSVTKEYLHSVIPEKNPDRFSFYNFVIHDIGEPKDMKDAVNLQYITDHCIIHDTKHSIDCKDKVLTNVKQGIAQSDAATMSQIMKLNNEKWDAEAKIITNVKNGVDTTDVATIGQVPLLREKQRFGFPRTAFDCKGYPLTNIGLGIGLTDAVTVGEWHERGLKKDFHKTVWNCDNLRLTSVSDPHHLNDAVNANYLMRILSIALYDIWNEIHPVEPDKKLHWIKENVVTKYFINPETQSFRSSSIDPTDKDKTHDHPLHYADFYNLMAKFPS